MSVATGIAPIGDLPWGAHFCHFYRTAQDLAETLVPFFKTGLEADEACLWVTAEPFGKEQAFAALNAHVDRLDARMGSGQIAIYNHAEWYDRYGAISPANVGRMWVESAAKATERGFTGLRLTGNTAFLEKDAWEGFMDYENHLREAFQGQRLLALCSYDTERCDADAVLDVVQAHDFALARRRGDWEVIENAALKQTKNALASLNAQLEDRIAARTQALTDALSHQRLLTAELSHRVKNTIAGVQSIVDQSLKTQNSLEQARTVVRGRLSAFARVHDQLAAMDWRGAGLREVVSAVLKPYGDRIRVEVNGELLAPRAAVGLSLILHELATNAMKYGALNGEGGTIALRSEQIGGSDPAFVLTWDEVGGPAVERPAPEGFGTRLIRQIVSHDLRGDCEMAFDRTGLRCTIRIPAAEVLGSRAGCAHAGSH